MILTFKDYNSHSEDHISMLWNMMRMIRELNEVPQLWKLTDPFLDSIADFMHLEPKNKIFTVTFLDTNIDVTTSNPVLICANTTYPLEIISHHK